MISELAARPLEKPWGRTELAPFFPSLETGDPIGEILFDPAGQSPLLVKYLFTSEALSVQVHPDDAVARRHGRAGGKEEAWLILAAEAGARIALGLRERVDPSTLAAAARDGSI